jgi:hypothetical protein
MSSFEWIGAIAGLIGGLTGLLGFGLQVWFHFATGPRVSVSTFWAANVTTGQQLFNFTIVNSGRITANVESISIEYSNTDHSPLNYFPNGAVSGPAYPLPVDSQSSANWLIDLESLQNAVSQIRVEPKIRVRIVLQTGKIVHSKEVNLPKHN